MDYYDPYLVWYMSITRRFIAPVTTERPDMRFHPSGSMMNVVPYWEVRQHPQQKSSYDLRSQSSDEGLSSEAQDSIDPSFQMNEKTQETSEPWWRKTSKLTEIMPKMEETKQFPYGIGASEGFSQRRWVPPQPPAVAMPEAAAAIQHQKPLAQKPQLGDEQSVASSDDGGG